MVHRALPLDELALRRVDSRFLRRAFDPIGHAVFGGKIPGDGGVLADGWTRFRLHRLDRRSLDQTLRSGTR